MENTLKTQPTTPELSPAAAKAMEILIEHALTYVRKKKLAETKAA